jgi:hypothetical protein
MPTEHTDQDHFAEPKPDAAVVWQRAFADLASPTVREISASSGSAATPVVTSGGKLPPTPKKAPAVLRTRDPQKSTRVCVAEAKSSAQSSHAGGSLAALAEFAAAQVATLKVIRNPTNRPPEEMTLVELEKKSDSLVAAVNEQLLECERAICSLSAKYEASASGPQGKLWFVSRKDRWGLYFAPAGSLDYRDITQMSINQRSAALALVPDLVQQLRNLRIERHRKLQEAVELGNEALKAVQAAMKGGL